ncbi:hypothetical protein ANO14919_145710 [Xylariales sp. No.14919]|nr:hypothetical protein ANO14919_145710 [Xylariales sp. No.14919]
MILGVISPSLHLFVALFLPTYQILRWTIRDLITILGPEIFRRWRLEAESAEYVKPIDLLQGIMDLATPETKQATAANVAHRQLVTSLAAEIVADVVNNPAGWDKRSLDKLEKVDDCFGESQGINSASFLESMAALIPLLISVEFHCGVEDPKGTALKDGKHLPAGTHICMASDSTTTDLEYIRNPNNFDPLRLWGMR